MSARKAGSGEWIFVQKKDVHKCVFPPVYNTKEVTTGDLWVCSECGAEYRAKVNFDQRDGNWISFEKTGSIHTLDTP
jgi:hypothetical protein